MRVDEWILPVPAEAIGVTAVREGLAHWPDESAVVSTRVPGDVRCVRVTVAGGDSPNLITDRPRLVFECWDPDEVGAEQLASRVAAVMLRTPGQWINGFFVRAWNPYQRPYNFPDPEKTRLFRYQMAGDLSVRPK